MTSLVEVLDIFFNGVTEWFGNVFTAIPESALFFLIGIATWSFLAIIDFYAENRSLWWWIGYGFFVTLAGLFSLWKFGLLFYIEDQMTWENIAEFLSIIFAIILVVALGFSFYKKNLWLKRLILVFMWTMFTLVTWLIAPLTGESELSWDTLVQFTLIVVVFAFPFLLRLNEAYQKAMHKKTGVE